MEALALMELTSTHVAALMDIPAQLAMEVGVTNLTEELKECEDGIILSFVVHDYLCK